MLRSASYHTHIIGSMLFWCVALLSAPASGQDFYRTEGTRIVAPNGMPEMKRGIGLGGWLVPEGYMLHTPGHWGPTRINTAIVDLIGENDAREFWALYRRHHVAEADVELIAEWGFDHVRLPLHYNLLYDEANQSFLEEGFATIDSLLIWSERNNLGVILDMHAAPGAQSDGPIADSDGTARLWTEPDPYQDMLVAIWEEIARRYAEEPYLIGYDLINEPVTPDSITEPGRTLRALYVRITDAIRQVDTNHIVFIEGNYFATTFDFLVPPFDSNMVYTFHKYWNPPNAGTINYLLAIRDNNNVPLWLGETGENSNVWYYGTRKLAEDNDIPWNFWTHKKIRTTTSPLSTPMLSGYGEVLDYWHDRGPRPSAADARTALFEQARHLRVDSARVNPGVLPALLDPDWSTLRRPVTENRIPGIINAAEYDLGTHQVTWSDSDYWAVSGSPGGGNSGTFLRNDGVDIERSDDSLGFAYNVGWLEPLEWMEYSVFVEAEGTYAVDVRLAALTGGGNLHLYMDGESIGQLTVDETGGWQIWNTQRISNLALTAGEHILRIAVGRRGGFNLNRLTFELTAGTNGEQQPVTRIEPDVYPIPGRGTLHVEWRRAARSETSVILLDMIGREFRRIVVPADEWKDELVLSLDGLSSGMYILRVISSTSGQQTGSQVFQKMIPVIR